MYYDCKIIRDLLPLYKDGALSENGKAAVQAHITTCPDCRRRLKRSTIKPIDTGAPVENGYLGLAKRIKLYKITTITAVSVTLAALLAYGIYKTIQDINK